MKLLKTSALVLCWASLFITLSSKAQIDNTTGNLINFTGTPTATTSNWNNGVYVNQLGCFGGNTPGNCGPYPNVQTNGSINFSYGQVNLNQIVNINKALEAGGSGVQLSGFNFAFTAKNGNGWDDGRQDYLSAYVKFFNSAGGLAANYDYTSQTNQRYNWTNFNFSETFANPVAASQFSNAQVGFVGRDNNYWAGPYGPEIMNVNFSLKYRVDPCALNPAYSPTCANFNTVATSNNLVSNPNGYAVYGDSINQSYAINTALASAGSAAQIHGFQWGYTANANGPYCAFWVLVCFDERLPKVQTHVNITDSNGASIYSVSRNYENSYNDTNYSYLFPASRPMSTLGNFNFSATTYDQAYVGSMYSRALYTADPCAVNPLSSPTCSGYAVAFAKTITATAPPAPAPPPPELAAAAPALAEASPAQASPAPAPPPPPAPMPDSSVAQSDPAQPSPTPSGPASTTPQPAGGPPQATQTASSSSSSGSPSSSSGGPSKLAMSVLKTAQANDKATQASAVQNAAKTLEAATQSSQASSNLAISMNQDMSANSAVAAATFASQTTQASQQTAMTQSGQQQQTVQASSQTQQASRSGPLVQQQQQDTQQVSAQSTSTAQYQPPIQQEQQQTQTQTSTSVVKLLQPQQEQQQMQGQISAGMMQPQQSAYTPPQQPTQGTQPAQVTMLKPPTPPVVEIQQQSSSGTGLTVSRNMFAYSPLTSSSSSSMATTTQQQPQMYQPKLDTKQFEVEVPQMPIASFSGSRAGNPLSEIMMQQRFEMMQNNVTAPTSSVNKNVQPNDLAGKVDIASMATVPTGFSAYSIVLKDSAFYEPKEVYKNQRTVDNERVLRGLTRGSDSLHQQMVDRQYK